MCWMYAVLVAPLGHAVRDQLPVPLRLLALLAHAHPLGLSALLRLKRTLLDQSRLSSAGGQGHGPLHARAY